MKKLFKSALVVALSVAVLVTFTPMFAVNANAAVKLAAPDSFSGVATTNKKIVLKWSPVENADGYVIYRNDKKLKTVAGTKFTNKVKKGKIYEYVVQPVGGEKSDPILVKAAKKKNPTKVTLKITSGDVMPGDIVKYKKTVTPKKSFNKTVTLTSSNNKVAKIEDGEIIAVAAGNCKITAKTVNGKTAKAYLEVLDVASELYYNGNIYTVEGKDWDQNPERAMAVNADGKIVALGTKDDLEKYCTEETAMINLKGKSVYPGFIDSHCHPPGTSMTELFEIDLYAEMGIPGSLAVVQEFIDENPNAETYWGSGFNYGMFGAYKGCTQPDPDNPTPAALLDEICDDKPIILTSNDGHSRWLNTAALVACGIDKDTAPQTGGNIQKDLETGDPTGIMTDCSALVTIPKEYTYNQYMEGMADFVETMNAWGYTGCSTGGMAGLEYAEDLDKSDEMTLRMNYSSNFYPEDTVEANMERLYANVESAEDCDDIIVQTAKFFCDGVVEGYTGFMLEPYVGDAAEAMGDDWTSTSKWDGVEDKWFECMEEVAKAGYQIHVHAIGDAAVQMTVDGIENAQEVAGDQDYRNVITHLQVVTNEDKERMGELGIIGALQPFWHFKEPDWFEPVDQNYLGEKRAWKEYPAKSLKDNGVVLTMSGDFPVSPINNPFWAIEASVTRNLNNADYYCYEDVVYPDILDENDPTYLLNPKERLAVKDAIEAYTINGAYQMYSEDICGSLAPGKEADFLILQENPLKVDVLDIDSIKVLGTFKAGEQVYPTN